MSLSKKAIALILLILFVDQLVKILVKTHMMLGEEISLLGKYGSIHFIENNGMAFGMEFGGSFGKMILSLFRLGAIAAIGYYLWFLIKNKAHQGLVLCIAGIFAGAIGNIIDSVFYGVIFSDSYYQVAHLFPSGGGYATWLKGRVVDMFYFPILQGHFPQWFPIWGGEEFVFFRPVFNLADSAISVGVILILIFQKRFFGKADEKATNDVQ
jgi:signal peptidase II